MLDTEISACVDYVLKILLGACYEQVASRAAIVYQAEPVAGSDRPTIQLVPSGFFGSNYGTVASLPKLPLLEIDGVPLLYGSPQIQRSEKRLRISGDIIASAYFMLTRYEEMVRRDVRDEHGRFPGRESLPCRAGFIDRPIIEEYAALVRKWLAELGVKIAEPERRFSLLLTHDVDRIRRYRRPLQPLWTAASALAGRQPLRNIPESALVSLGLKRDPFNTFGEMIAMDAIGYGSAEVPTKSVYFFMAGGKSRYDGYYDIASKAARKTIGQVRDSGAEIGLHASYEAGMDPDLVAEEKARLEQLCGFSIRRNRHHYLAWREIEEGWALVKAGIDWDSTLGYADVAGFRLGVCRPIPLFDPVTIRLLGIEEHPLIIMDSTVQHPVYMGLDEEGAMEYCSRLVDETKNHQGELVVLWHTTPPPGIEPVYHRTLYTRLVSYAVTARTANDHRHRKT